MKNPKQWTLTLMGLSALRNLTGETNKIYETASRDFWKLYCNSKAKSLAVDRQFKKFSKNELMLKFN